MSKPPPSRRAAQYLRMSTDRQPHSPANQASVIAAYALAKGYEIVRTYEDDAVSGTSARGREAFQSMLATVLGGRADFQVLLVYDVSRFGRFQDPDEAAHYEWLCRREGVRVEYCAEAIDYGSPAGALLKGLKRVMAAEYSRELGEKVRSAQRRLSAEGHWQYGRPGYGLRRRIVGADGRFGQVLEEGERGVDPREHTVLVAGPAREVALVRQMFTLCVRERRAPGAIARELNLGGKPGPGGRPWTGRRVRAVLTNPKYAGTLVTQRRRTPIGGRTTMLPQDMWVRADASAARIIGPRTFARAQAVIASQARPSDRDLLDTLSELAARHGVLTEPKLQALGVEFYRAYRHRFGSLRAAYGAIGYAAPKHHPKKMDDAAMLRGLAVLFLQAGDLTGKLIDAEPTIPSADHYRVRFGSLAAAYGRIGFLRLSDAELASPVGQARLVARDAIVRARASVGASQLG
jgi:DNA invertase Pin-like site-specific DNA recombinase